MDTAWAEQKLVAYLSVCNEVRRAVPPGEIWNEQAARANERAELMIVTVQKILHAIDPSDTGKLLGPNYPSAGGEERVRRALGALRDQAEVDKHLAPAGPDLPADELHPTVWRAASVIWPTGEYRTAVGQASLALETVIKARAGSRLSGRKLMQDVFSPELPRANTTRLHFNGDRAHEMWSSRQGGLHLLAQGAYLGIRNVSAHDEEPWTEQVALEALAVLSVVARWSESTTPVHG